MKEMRQSQFVCKKIVISHEKLKYCLVVRDVDDDKVPHNDVGNEKKKSA